MIDRLILRAGTREQYNNRFQVPAAPMTLFIGPNNSGKTLLLKEVAQELTEHGPNRGVEVLLDMEYRTPSEAEARLLLEGTGGRRFPLRGPPIPGHRYPLYHLSRPTGSRFPRLFTSGVEDLLEHGTFRVKELASLLTLVTDLSERRQLLSEAEGPASILGLLIMDPVQSRCLSTQVHEAIGWHFSIDFSPFTSPRAMLNRSPIPAGLEQSYSEETRAFHESGKPLADFSDGVRSFVGILAAYLCADLRVFVIDEPEAYLHPPLARRLGRVMADLSSSMSATTLAATHSPEFVMGCVQSGTPTTVVRQTYENGVASFFLLSSADLASFMNEPRLRSSGVLNALFHRCAIVTEADADRAFYEETNLRLLEGSHGTEGAEDCCFLNANGKDSMDRIVCMLRRMGLPAAAIADLDLLHQGGLMQLLKAANMPEAIRNGIASAKSKAVGPTTGASVKEKGVEGASDPAAVRDLLGLIAEYGVFLVPVGELEHWLHHLGICGDKSTWLGRMLDRMGSDPTDPDYVRAGQGDVWDFLRKLGSWLRNPTRKGMPSGSDAAIPAG